MPKQTVRMDSQDMTARTAMTKGTGRTGKKGLIKRDMQNETHRKGEAEQDRQNRIG
jgi:hypothetical protein